MKSFAFCSIHPPSFISSCSCSSKDGRMFLTRGNEILTSNLNNNIWTKPVIRTLFANIIDTCVIEDEFLTFLCILTEAETLYLFDVKDTTFKCIQKSICRNMIGDKVKKPILVASKEFIIIHTRNRTLTIFVLNERKLISNNNSTNSNDKPITNSTPSVHAQSSQQNPTTTAQLGNHTIGLAFDSYSMIFTIYSCSCSVNCGGSFFSGSSRSENNTVEFFKFSALCLLIADRSFFADNIWFPVFQKKNKKTADSLLTAAGFQSCIFLKLPSTLKNSEWSLTLSKIPFVSVFPSVSRAA